MSEKDDSALPLVSIIIRSMDRATLSDALDSVACQTYKNIEVVVVNAKGSCHNNLGDFCGKFPLRFIQSEKPLARSKAANTGLNAATGDYLIFLDDDDLFYPEHISSLVTTLQNQQNALCAYAGVHVEYYIDEKIAATTDFNEPFDLHRLRGRNFIPIHAMLFAKSLVTNGCQFDEALNIFEDWDFWLQLTKYSDVLHIDEINAVYRNFGHSGLGLTQDENLLRQARGQIYDKWSRLLSGEQLDDIIQYREDVINDANKQLTSLQQNVLAYAEREKQSVLTYAEREKQSALAYTEREKQNTLAYAEREKILRKTIDDLAHSTSWRITGPLRFLIRIIRGQHREALAGVSRRLSPLLKKIYWLLPIAWRNTVLKTAYRTLGSFFSGMEHYEAWHANNNYSIHQFPTASTAFLAEMVDISNIKPLKIKSPGRIAIHAHIFYPDLAAEFANYLHNMPFAYDLFVSTPNEAASDICSKAFSSLPLMEQLNIAIVPNQGRDIAPMFCAFGESLQSYDYIAHLHSKKSLYNKGATDGWREYLLTNLLGSKTQISRIFTLLSGEQNAGIVYPQNFSRLPYSAYTWLSNQTKGRIWCQKLGIRNFPTGYFDFPAGSMFWAKTAALQPLFDARMKMQDFPEEAGQKDATLAHCLERLLVLVTKQCGFNAFILRDTQLNSWSRWRFDQYLARKPERIHAMLEDLTVRIIVFDIFDTLLTRPLLNPESIKSIIAQQAGGEIGQKYLQFRATAEAHARQKAGRDIDLDAIYSELATLSKLPLDTIARLRHLEETIEMEAVSPRPEVIALLKLAKNSGKRILLASDMYLPKSTIKTMLKQHGITAWDQLYLSSDIGLRKDSGDLYRYLLAQEHTHPDAVMVIGDNEHSDIQVPADLGTRCLHIMRPVELARAIPRLGPIVEESLNQNDLSVQLTLGMIARENFQPLFFPSFNPADFVPATPRAIGYTIAGPLVLAFVQWLEKKAAEDSIQRLYFLAREGQILKMVYDQWTAHDTNAIPSDYLVLSRRTVAVPMISNLEDIFEIARVQFSPNNLATFLQERYGLTLSQEEHNEYTKRKLWPKNKLVSVENHNIDHLMPLLKALEVRILDQSHLEHPALMTYLDTMKLNSSTSSAIVDIGYAATIQGRLNRLVNQAIHGYYLITDERAHKVSTEFNVITQGCFGHYVNAFSNPPLIFEKSFSLEKLLSSNDPQIVRYQSDNVGKIAPEFRDLTDEERQTMATREEIRQGIMDFVDQSITVRDKLVNDFAVPPNIAKNMFETFIKHPSQTELEILSKLTLDDYYCGRGLVN